MRVILLFYTALGPLHVLPVGRKHLQCTSPLQCFSVFLCEGRPALPSWCHRRLGAWLEVHSNGRVRHHVEPHHLAHSFPGLGQLHLVGLDQLREKKSLVYMTHHNDYIYCCTVCRKLNSEPIHQLYWFFSATTLGVEVLLSLYILLCSFEYSKL